MIHFGHELVWLLWLKYVFFFGDVEEGMLPLLPSNLDLKETKDMRSGPDFEGKVERLGMWLDYDIVYGGISFITDVGKLSASQKVAPKFTMEAELDNITAAYDDGSPSVQFKVKTQTNATATESDPYRTDKN